MRMYLAVNSVCQRDIPACIAAGISVGQSSNEAGRRAHIICIVFGIRACV